jgi:uncharacterized protein (TIGR03437 family)
MLATDVVAAVTAKLATHDLALASPQSLVSIYGNDFAAGLIRAEAGPLPSQLGGLRVTVLDSKTTQWIALLYFVSPGQIQFVVPDVALGTARLEISSDDGRIWTGAIEIANVAPGLFSANADGEGVAAATILTIASDGTQSYSDAFRCGPAAGTCAPAPIDLGDESTETHLILPGTGLRNASKLNIWLGGVASEVVNWGAQPQHAGLDQIEVRIPRDLMGRGLVQITGDADGKSVNPLFIQFN